MAVLYADRITCSAEATLGIDVVELEGDPVMDTIAFGAVENRDVAGADPADAGQTPALQRLPLPEVPVGIDTRAHDPFAYIYALPGGKGRVHRYALDLESVRHKRASAKMKDRQRCKHDQHPHHHRDDDLRPLRLERLVKLLPPILEILH